MSDDYFTHRLPCRVYPYHEFNLATGSLQDWFAVKKWAKHTLGSEEYVLPHPGVIVVFEDANAVLFKMVWVNDSPPFDGSW